MHAAQNGFPTGSPEVDDGWACYASWDCIPSMHCEPDAITATATMGSLLDGDAFMRPVAVGSLLGGKIAAKSGSEPLAEYFENSGVLSADRA
jgi:hypothetical protein